MTAKDETGALLPASSANDVSPGVYHAAEETDWRQTDNSIFFDTRTLSSLDEMRGSTLESCCPGDGVLSGALSLITTAATPSMLSIPLAFVVGGPAFATTCILFCILLTLASVRILALAAVSADSDDYETVAGAFLGAKGRWVLRLVLFVYNFGGSVVYLAFIKDSFTPLLKWRATFLPYWLRGEVGGALCLVASMVVITPLTFNSRLASVRTKGLISSLFTVVILASIAYRYYVPALGGGEEWEEEAGGPLVTSRGEANALCDAEPSLVMSPWLRYLFVAPIFIFSYEVQSNVMGVIKDLHDRSGKRLFVSVAITLAVITTFYGLLGFLGSLAYPRLGVGNILLCYNLERDTLMMVSQLLCSFSAAIAFVFSMFPCRQAAFMFLSGGQGTKIPRRTRMRLGVGLSTAATTFAIFLPDVAQAVSVLGALFSSTLSMTFPALFSMKMRGAGTYLTGWRDGLIGWALLLCGAGFSLAGTAMSVAFLV